MTTTPDPSPEREGLREAVCAGLRAWIACTPDIDLSSRMITDAADFIIGQPFEMSLAPACLSYNVDYDDDGSGEGRISISFSDEVQRHRIEQALSTHPGRPTREEDVERVARSIMQEMMTIDGIAKDLLDDFMRDPKADQVRKLARAAIRSLGGEA